MFEPMEYVNLEVGEVTKNKNVVTIPINIITNEKKIDEDIEELEQILLNLRKIFKGDYGIIVTDNGIKFLRDMDE